MQKTSQQLRWVDELRALCMLLVVIGHIFPGSDNFFRLTSPVKLPGFFLLSGFLFHYETCSPGLFAKKKCIRLLIPYFCFSVISLFWNMFLLQRGAAPEVYWDIVLSFFKGLAYWFLPCTLLAETVFYILVRLCKGRLQFLAPICLGLLIFGMLFCRDMILPWHLSAVPIVLFFLFVGYAYRTVEERLRSYESLWLLLGLVLLYAGLTLLRYRLNPMCLDMNMSRYPVPWLDILLSLIGCFALILLFKKLPLPRFVSWIGKNTLPLYAFHMLIADSLKVFCRHFGLEALIQAPYFPYLQLLAGVVFSLLLAAFFNRFAPFVVGREKKRKPAVQTAA